MDQTLPSTEAAPTPLLPQALRRVLASGMRSWPIAAEAGGGVRLDVDPRWQPPALTPDLLLTAERARDLLRDHLAPVAPESFDRLGSAIGQMLAHSWRGRAPEELSQRLQEALIVDWIGDLAEFPAWAVRDAMRRWRRTQPWRPTISDIRGLCEEAVRDDRRSLDLLERLVAAQVEAPLALKRSVA